MYLKRIICLAMLALVLCSCDVQEKPESTPNQTEPYSEEHTQGAAVETEPSSAETEGTAETETAAPVTEAVTEATETEDTVPTETAPEETATQPPATQPAGTGDNWESGEVEI